MLPEELLAELTKICEGAKEMVEGGYTFVYLPGLKISNFVHPDDYEPLASVIAQLVTGAPLFLPVEFRLKRKSGEWGHMQGRATNLLNHPDIPPSGAGEPSSRPVAAAIANAIFDATGVRLRRVPFTPGNVKAAFS